MKKTLMIITAVYILAGVVFYFTQQLFFFHPKEVDRNHQYQFGLSFEETNTSFKGKNLNIIRFGNTDSAKGIVLFFHGNMNNVEYYKKYPPLFSKNNYAVWMIDYPGFGKTEGNISEQLLYEQSLYMYKQAAKKFSPADIIIYGKSIGTGIASFLASQKPCSHLVLETPYYNMASLVKRYLPIYPVPWLLKFRFPNHEYLQKISSPVIIFHGTEDGVIPYKHAKKLATGNKTIELITIEGGKHNDLFEKHAYQQKMNSMLSAGN